MHLRDGLPDMTGENDWWNNPAPLAYQGGNPQAIQGAAQCLASKKSSGKASFGVSYPNGRARRWFLSCATSVWVPSSNVRMGLKAFTPVSQSEAGCRCFTKDEQCGDAAKIQTEASCVQYQGIKGIMMDDSHKVEDKVKLIFMKHGIPPVNKALIQDIIDLVGQTAAK
eukprot:s1971_g3.t1